MSKDFHYWVRLVLTIPALFIGIAAPFVGTVIDRFGRKFLLAFVVLLYGITGTSEGYRYDPGRASATGAMDWQGRLMAVMGAIAPGRGWRWW